jgi:hypothetical protein
MQEPGVLWRIWNNATREFFKWMKRLVVVGSIRTESLFTYDA